MSAICQREFSRNVRSNWLLILIGFLLDLFDQLLQAREFFRREMFRFDKTHHKTLRRAAEEASDNVLYVLADDLFTGDRGLIEICAILERSFCFAFAFEDVEHRLDGGVGK